MIELSIDISYLERYYGISTARSFAAQSTTDDDENITIETEDGQVTVNGELLQKLLEEPEKLAKIMQLEDPMNRYLIIQEFNEDDLVKLLPFLNSEELAFGLQYFTMDGLNELMINLPSEQMVNLLLEHFTMADVVPFMQVTELDEFFKNTDLEKKDVLDYFEGMDYEKIQQLMVNQFGVDFEGKSQEEYLEYIENMEDKEYHQFLMNMETEEKREALAGLCDINPDYYLLVDNSILARPMMNNLEKEEIIKTMTTLDPEFLIPMVEELPMDLIQVVATQIDPVEFSKFLASDFSDMLVEMLAAG